MAIYFFDKNQTLIKIVPESATFEAIQTQELDDESLLKDTLSVTVKGDEKLLNAEYMAVKSYKGNAQTFDMYRIVTDTTPDKSMSFTGMSLAPYELNGHILQDLRPANHSLSYTLNRILDGTDWRVGYIEDGLPNVTTTFYYVSAKEALKELQSLVGCEFVFKVEISGQKITDKWIEVYKEMGNRTKKRFNYGTNTLTVVRETNKADIYTALIGRGKGEEVSSGEDNESGQAGYGRKITFEDIEWKKSSGKPLDKPKGQYYLELPQATQAYGIKNIDGTMKARVGIVDFDDEEDKNRLINLTYQQLLVSSRPKVLFKTTVANIGATGIGDTVTIHRHDLNIHYQTRVRKIVRNKLNDNKTQIELGDAVVTASTKRAKQNNATIKNLNQEIEKVKADVTISQNSADGKNTIFYGSAEPDRQRTGDTWYRPHPSIAGETQMLVWNGNAWELVIDTSDLTSVSRAVEDAADKADEAVQTAQDADVRANEAIEKAGANANLLTTHQNTLNTISNTTLPDINKSLSDAIGDAKSAISSASSAMAEAKRADGKIADYVTKNGLVNGTTVDSKIDTATGEISKKITTVESKIPTELGGTNLLVGSAEMKFSPEDSSENYKYLLRPDIMSIASKVKVGDTLTFSFDIWSEETTGIRIYDSNGNPNMQFGSEQITVTKDKKRFSFTKTLTATNKNNFKFWYMDFYNNNNGIKFWVENIKIEKGSIPSDWSPAPEDNYTQEEFKIFESTYNEDVKGINSTLTELSNKKVDGTTYQDFYNNEYKKTAKGVTDTYNKVNKIIDANGNSTDAFAKAVYDRNATRQSADFNEVTKDLVKEATYTAGINGINQSISTVQGNLDNLSVGGRNLVLNSHFPNSSMDSGWSAIYGRFIYVNDTTLRFTNNGTHEATRIEYRPRLEVLEPDTWYTFSMRFRSDRGLDVRTFDYASPEDEPFLQSIGEYSVQSFRFRTNSTGNQVVLRFYQRNPLVANGVTDIDWVKIEKGRVATDWTPAPEDMLGQADFTIFKNDYDETAKKVERRLTAIDSSADGSVVTRLNETEKTASGNKTTISNIKTKPGEQITGYQTILERSDLYERVIGSSSEASVKQNISRVVMTDSVFKVDVADKLNAISTYSKVYQVNTANPKYITDLNGDNLDSQKSYDITLGVLSTGTITSFICSLIPDHKGSWKLTVHSQSGTSSNHPYVEIANGKPRVRLYGHTSFYTVEVTISEVGSRNKSALTMLSDNINLKVSKDDLISQINVQAGGVLITSGTNKLNVTPTTTYIENGTIKSAMIESLDAGKVTTGELDAGKVKVVNLDANSITGNLTEFIKTNWNAVNAFTQIDASGIHMMGSGTWRRTFLSPTGFRLFNGVDGSNKSGAIGYFKSSKDLDGLSNPLKEDFMWQTQQRHAIGIGVNETHLLTLGYQLPRAGNSDGYNPALTIDPQKNGQVTISTDARVNLGLQVDGNLTLPGGDVFTTYNGLYLNTSYWTVKAKTGVRFFVGDQKKIHIGGNVELGTTLDMAGNTITGQSDCRLKKDIETLNSNDLDKLTGVRMVSYKWIDPERPKGTHVGFIAQELQEVYPEFIMKNDEGILSINNSELAMAHIHATQELNAKVDAHISSVDDEVADLKAQIASLQDELALLKGA